MDNDNDNNETVAGAQCAGTDRSIDPDRERGLYDKYTVTRTDGSSGPGGKHEHCQYFVLDVTHDPHALPALRAYAVSCHKDYPALSTDLGDILLTAETRRREEHVKSTRNTTDALNRDAWEREAAEVASGRRYFFHRGYAGHVVESTTQPGGRVVYHGRVIDIPDVITFETDTPDPRKVEDAFNASVDDYLEMCASRSEAPCAPNIPDATTPSGDESGRRH